MAELNKEEKTTYGKVRENYIAEGKVISDDRGKEAKQEVVTKNNSEV